MQTIQKLREENEDLEALKEINDELEEQHQETEKQLRTENGNFNWNLSVRLY